jgi:hypothetical protein
MARATVAVEPGLKDGAAILDLRVRELIDWGYSVEKRRGLASTRKCCRATKVHSGIAMRVEL